MPDSEEYPVATSATGIERHVVTVDYRKVEQKIDDSMEESNPCFVYRDSLKSTDTTITSSTEFQALRRWVNADEVGSCRDAIQALEKRTRTQLPIKLDLEEETSVRDHLWYLAPLGLFMLVQLLRKTDVIAGNPLMVMGLFLAGTVAATIYLKTRSGQRDKN